MSRTCQPVIRFPEGSVRLPPVFFLCSGQTIRTPMPHMASPAASRLTGEIILFSGCRDDQTSADVKVGDMVWRPPQLPPLGANGDERAESFW